MKPRDLVLNAIGILFSANFAPLRLRYIIQQGPLLLTWINFNLSMDKESHAQ